MREVGALLLVFVPLETTFHQGAIRVGLVVFFTVLGFVGIAWGIEIEKEVYPSDDE